MRRALALLVIAPLAGSCGQPAPAVRPPARSRVAVPADAAVPVGPPSITHAPRAVIEGPHGAPIGGLALTPDGGAVLSIDQQGGARLWPALDGTREPRLVELPAAVALALGRDGDGFMAVARDQVGGLYIAKLDADGRTRSHTTYGVDPPYVGMAMSARGLVAWRSDHHVLLIDADGAVVSELATEPQQRVVSIAVAGSQAIAIIDRDGKNALRWLRLAPRLAWGDWLVLAGDSAISPPVALSPDHAHVAVQTSLGNGKRVSIRDVRAGTEHVGRDVPGTIAGIAFADDRLVAVSGTSGVIWLVASDTAVSAPAAQVPVPAAFDQRRHMVGGAGRAIVPHDAELMLLAPTSAEYLGYDTPSPQFAHAAADGGVLLGTGANVHLLDRELRSTGPAQLGLVPRAMVAEVQWLGGGDWLVESSRPDGKTQVALVDLPGASDVVVRGDLGEPHVMAYEPTTDLVTLSFGSAAEVAHVDRKKRTLDSVATITRKTPYEQVVLVPVSPALARGTPLVKITMRDKPTIAWIPDARSPDKATATLTLDGAYLGTDAAARVYAWATMPSGKLEVGVFVDGRQTATLPAAAPTSLWPDPQGTRVIEVSRGTLSLFEPTGKELWTRELAGVYQAVWLSDGGLLVVHPSGVARLDAATGAITSARCGWGFGLSTMPHPFSVRVEPVCAQHTP